MQTTDTITPMPSIDDFVLTAYEETIPDNSLSKDKAKILSKHVIYDANHKNYGRFLKFLYRKLKRSITNRQWFYYDVMNSGFSICYKYFSLFKEPAEEQTELFIGIGQGIYIELLHEYKGVVGKKNSKLLASYHKLGIKGTNTNVLFEALNLLHRESPLYKAILEEIKNRDIFDELPKLKEVIKDIEG
jgi:hypothetical protein